MPHAGRRKQADAELAARARARLGSLSGASRRRRVGGWVPERAAANIDQPGGYAEPAGSATVRPKRPGSHSVLHASLRDRLPLWLRAAAEPAPDEAHQRGGEIGLERGHAVVILLVVMCAVAGALVLLLNRPAVVPVGSEMVTSGTPVPAVGAGSAVAPDQSAAPQPAGGATEVIIHVAGLVARPGVVKLPAGARVIDAIEAAGGADPDVDLSSLNLARVLSDGEQVLVGVDPPPGTVPGPGSGAQSQSLINLNSATLEQLETLPGIGPELAQRILDWRAENGRFTAVDELREVSGIGEKKFAQIAALVVV